MNDTFRIPDDFQSALALNAPACEAFSRLSDEERRQFLSGIAGAGAVDDRMAVIDAAVRALGGGLG